MANPLTGDFRAVLQVSGGTFNRLLASMHQNAWRNPETPSFPHSTALRLGDTVQVDGVQGTAYAQIGVPRIELIDRATDRFQLEVSLRIRYVADPDTEPLPTYIHGKLRAVYALEDIDPNCPGWRKLAPDYWWIRVVEDSVSFDGTYADDDWFSALAVADDATMNAKVTRQLEALLVFAFEAAPHKVGRRFRRGSFVSLNQGDPAVAVPFSIDDDPQVGPPPGTLASLTNVFLDGYDFAVAISTEMIMALVEPALAEIRAYTETYQVTASGVLGSISTVYRSWVDWATAEWKPQGATAVIEVKVHGGANTESVLPNLTFDVTQTFHLDFDGGSEALRLWAGGCSASVTSALPGSVKSNIGQTIANTVQGKANAAAADAAPYLGTLATYRQKLNDVVTSMDADAGTQFEMCWFSDPGVVLQGRIWVAPRRKPKIKIGTIGDEALTGFESWIPGGRIDKLEWSWSWATSIWVAGEAAHTDRFVLARPPGRMGKFGQVALRSPLPGLDGSGTVCLRLVGRVVDATTGALVRTEFGEICTRWGFIDTLRVDQGRLHLRDYEYVPPADKVPGAPGPVEHGLLQVTALDGGAVSATNTLIVYADEEWAEVGSTLVEGLDGCGRDDAGLLVMMLLPDGTLANGDRERRRGIEKFAAELEAPMLVNEDVEGAWSRAFAVPTDRRGAPSWRLLSPTGGVLWMQDGRLAGEELAGVLDRHLYPSPPARPRQVQEDMEVVMLSPETLAWLFAHPHPERPHCPPWELRGVNVHEIVSGVTFVRSTGRSPAELAERLRAEHGARSDDDPDIVVVLDAADQSEADALAEVLGPAFTVVPDPGGALAHRIGVRVWPTTVSLTDAVLAEQGADVQ